MGAHQARIKDNLIDWTLDCQLRSAWRHLVVAVRTNTGAAEEILGVEDFEYVQGIQVQRYVDSSISGVIWRE